jgi:L,D-transpeptidase ErfK/SrfK
MPGLSLLSSRLARALLAAAVLNLPSWAAYAEVFNMPPPGSDLIGELRQTRARANDSLIEIARDFSVGQDEIVMANPAVDRWLPGEGRPVLLPRRFILPEAPRSGIVVNVPEMRLYYFIGGPKGANVISYPISIGRMDWRSPLGVTKVAGKIKDPAWRPPETIKREHAADGDILPDVVPPGPNNPLGRYAMRLGVPGYLIHGTGEDKAFGIGMRVTHGCIRMYPEDVEKLFPLVNVGTSVNLVNQPIKLGWVGETLYIEISQPLDEDRLTSQQLYDQAKESIAKKTAGRASFALNEAALRAVVEKPTGIPTIISGGQRTVTAMLPESSRAPTPPVAAPATPAAPSVTAAQNQDMDEEAEVMEEAPPIVPPSAADEHKDLPPIY